MIHYPIDIDIHYPIDIEFEEYSGETVIRYGDMYADEIFWNMCFTYTNHKVTEMGAAYNESYYHIVMVF